ncbi:hypothetical protein GT348_02255 [Aristophania vespae]|uniref:Uncharacterized protein n=1 Tax=Aristophania vespae TaxID=2697033 RepID=A0A6P1NHX2_9PROT|nr:hypothetical protein [Aristophania vespae]QHI95252.1 hypothetical protein GT348_02255 [Aristophania vespae]UMM64500.1 hypothetical protein DM15PD_15150 [Aristophania vespae]
MSITLDPNSLPSLDIIGLSQSGQIVRAERHTQEDGIPSFIIRQDWDALKTREGHEQPAYSDEALLIALEKISAHFLQEAAKTFITLGGHESEKRPPAIFEIESDLFLNQKKVFLLLVRDKAYPVICALIGSSSAILQSLKENQKKN